MKNMHPLPIIELKLVDVEANVGCREAQWFKQYSDKIGGEYTPAIQVGENGKVFYLWGKKGDTPTEEEISSAGKLKSDIIMEMQRILSSIDKEPTYYDKDMFNRKDKMFLPNYRMRFMPFGGFECQENSF